MRRCRPALLWILLASLGLAQRAAIPEVRVSASPYILPPPLVQAQSALVPLEVVVRRPNGTLVDGLTRQSFVVLDDGQPRTLAAFNLQRRNADLAAVAAAGAPAPVEVARPAAPPRAVGLYFDDVNTDNRDLGNARNAALRYLREDSGGSDRVAVFTASGIQSLAFTADHARLLAAVAAIRAHPRQASSVVPCPRITPYQAYLITDLNDITALQAAADEAANCPGNSPTDDLTGQPLRSLGLKGEWAQEPLLAQAQATWALAQGVSEDTLTSIRGGVAALARQPGTRMLLIASGGFLADGSILGEQQDKLIQESLRAGVVINSLDAKGLFTDGPGRPLGEAVDSGTLPLSTFIFEETSKMTVRQAQDAPLIKLAQSTGGLFFHDNSDLTLGFERLGMIPELTYELAFSPGAIPHDGKYHTLKVRVSAPGRTLVQARPGYFAPAPGLSTRDIADQMDAAMRAGSPQSALPAQIGWKPEPGGERIYIRLDPSTLPFVVQDGRRRLRLQFVAGLFNQQGEFVTGKQGAMDLALTPATYQRLAAQGLGVNLDLTAPPGAYRLRVVAAELNTGHIFAASQPVTLSK